MQCFFEDQWLMIVEKPSGMPCLPAKEGILPTMVDLLELRECPLPDYGLVHRLDNETSGVLIIAKTLEAYESLRKQFSEDTIKKEYLTLVLGYAPDKGRIETTIAHHPRKKKKMVVCESEAKSIELKARPARTDYICIEHLLLNKTPYSLLRVTISTGVRHQIRAHFASIGFPVAGDELYQNQKKRSEDCLRLMRHFLHASRIVFEHPTTRERIDVESPLPEELHHISR